MLIEIEDAGDARLIRIAEDRIDAAAAIAFKDEVIRAARDGPPRIVLDLEAVAFIDSSGLGAIVAVMKRLTPGQQTDLAALSPAVRKVFRLTRMDSVFRLFPTVSDALAERVA